MKIKCIIISIFFCVSSFHVLAQAQDEILIPVLPENAMDLLEIINQIEITDQSSLISTEQIGENNTLDIQLTQEDQLFLNVISVAQYGMENSGTINQFGHGQELGILQDGDFNQAIVNINGMNVQSLITQVGNGNFVEQDIENSILEATAQKIVSTEQYGDDNNITLEAKTMDYGTIQVTQFGDNNVASLDFTGLGSPGETYGITQSGGAAITVSQSAFNMPMQPIGN